MARKQSSDRVSRIAGRLLGYAKRNRLHCLIFPNYTSRGRDVTKDVLVCVASALSQDETKGKRKK